MAAYSKYKARPAARAERGGAAVFFMDRLDRVLHLSASQRQAIRPVMEDATAKLRKLREPILAQEEAVLDEAAQAVQPHLDPGQQEKYRSLVDRVRKQRRNLFGPDAAPPATPGAPAPPGR